MFKIGDKVILDKRLEDHPMISKDQWEKYINCQIVFIGMDGSYRVRNGWNMESIAREEELIKMGE